MTATITTKDNNNTKDDNNDNNNNNISIFVSLQDQVLMETLGAVQELKRITVRKTNYVDTYLL